MHMPRLPRMADFALVFAAADAAGVTSGALPRLLGQQGRIAEEVIESDIFAVALVQFVHKCERWQGTASDLLERLIPATPEKPPRGWPKPNGVKGQLKRLIPALATQGVFVQIPATRTNRGRIYTLEYRRSEPSPSSLDDNSAANSPVRPLGDPSDGGDSAQANGTAVVSAKVLTSGHGDDGVGDCLSPSERAPKQDVSCNGQDEQDWWEV